MQMYVNQHDFFISQDRFLQESEQATGYQLEGDAEPSKDDERADMYVESPTSGFVEANFVIAALGGNRSMIQIYPPHPANLDSKLYLTKSEPPSDRRRRSSPPFSRTRKR